MELKTNNPTYLSIYRACLTYSRSKKECKHRKTARFNAKFDNRFFTVKYFFNPNLGGLFRVSLMLNFADVSIFLQKISVFGPKKYLYSKQ